MKKIVMFMLIAVFSLTLAACSGGGGQSTDTGTDSKSGDKKGEPIKIGLITMDLSNEFFAHVVEGMEALEQQSQGKITIDVADGKSSPDVQAQAFDNFINAGMDIIMSSTLDPYSIADASKRALDKGIIVGTYPVIEGMTTCLTWDEYKWGYDLGEEAGKWIAEKLNGEATIACFYQAETPSALDRYKGYMEGVLAHNDKGKINFLEPVNAITPEPAMTAMESIIQAHPECKVVLSVADAPAIASYKVLKSNGKLTDDMFIGGCDGDSEAIDLVLEGTQYRCSSASKVYVSDLWYGLVQNAIRAYLDMDYVYNYPAPTIPVTKDTAEEYKNMGAKFIFDEDIAKYLGITTVDIGTIGANHYDSKTGKNPATEG